MDEAPDQNVPGYKAPGLDLTADQCDQLTAFVASLLRPTESLPQAAVADAIRHIEANPDVRYAVPNYIRHAYKDPNDPSYSKLWNLHNRGQEGGVAGADIHARSDEWSQVMAVPPHGLPAYNRAIPHGGETALMFAARVGDLASAKLLVAAGANVNDTDSWGVSATVLAEHSGYSELAEFLLDHGADANAAKAGFTALHEAIMRRDERTAAALLAHGADPNAPVRTWTPTRRSSDDFNFPPEFIGATPFWLAARFSEPNVMRLLLKQGADPLFVHRVEYFGGLGAEPRQQATTALMAAVAMGGGAAWVPVDRSEREALTLETVKLALELGVDINAVNADGRTALDGAKTLKYDSIVKFLTDKGAKAGTPRKREAPPAEAK